jgi:predicted transporter
MLFFGFVTVAALSGLALIMGRFDQNADLERTLGMAMILIGSYFMISALVLPQYGQIQRVYRLAAYSAEGEGPSGASLVYLLFSLLALAAAGFCLGLRRFSLSSGRGKTKNSTSESDCKTV